MLCDAGCSTTFTKGEVKFYNNDNIILTGVQDKRTQLWILPLESTEVNNTVNTITQTNDVKELVDFYHATTFRPVKTTFVKAIKHGFFQSWMGLNKYVVRKHLSAQTATAKGHLDQAWCRQQSTCDDKDNNPKQEENNEITNFIISTVQTTDKIYSDKTGRFPYLSSKGFKYIFILYEYDPNSILEIPIKSRKD